jgi:hypothetical protein
MTLLQFSTAVYSIHTGNTATYKGEQEHASGRISSVHIDAAVGEVLASNQERQTAAESCKVQVRPPQHSGLHVPGNMPGFSS